MSTKKGGANAPASHNSNWLIASVRQSRAYFPANRLVRCAWLSESVFEISVRGTIDVTVSRIYSILGSFAWTAVPRF